MATMIDGESYVGKVLVRPLSQDGGVSLYLWPLRCLKAKFGGPTFGVDVNGEEMIRFDPHGPRGHWHKGGYDKLGAGGSHVDFPEGLIDSEGQVDWSFDQIRQNLPSLLEDAAQVDPSLVEAAVEAAKVHLEEQGDLRPGAIEAGLLEA